MEKPYNRTWERCRAHMSRPSLTSLQPDDNTRVCNNKPFLWDHSPYPWGLRCNVTMSDDSWTHLFFIWYSFGDILKYIFVANLFLNPSWSAFSPNIWIPDSIYICLINPLCVRVYKSIFFTYCTVNIFQHLKKGTIL